MKLFSRRSIKLPSIGGLSGRLRRKVAPKEKPPAEPTPVFAIIQTPQRQSKFQITESGVREVDEIPESGATLFVFDGNSEPKDRRLTLPKRMSDRAALETVYETVDEKCRMIRFPKDPKVVYARDLLSLDLFAGNRVIPGTMIVDHLLGTNLEGPTVFPIVFLDASGKTQQLIQFVVRPSDDKTGTVIGNMQVTAKPDGEIYEYTAQFAQKNRISIVGDLAGASDGDLLSLAGILPAYPTENEFFGIPISRLYRNLAIGAAGLTVIGLACNIYFGVEAGYLAISSNIAERDRDEVARAVTKLLTTEVRAFARAVSIDDRAVIQHAAEIWHPNAITKIGCTPQKCSIDLIGGMQRVDNQGVSQAGSQLMSTTVDEQLVRDVLLQNAPTGYRKQNITISGDANVITVTFEQQKPSLPIFDLLPN